MAAIDSETLGWEYTIPDDMEAKIENGKIIVRKKESEDDKIRGKLLQWLKLKLSNPKVGFVCEEMKQWIAWLEKQGEQKPAWSEEDEENLNQLHKLIVKKAYEEYEIDTEDETLYGKWLKLDNWLKSLKPRPQWKPSEEQIEALDYAKAYLVNDELRHQADLLYNDLKKLKW